MTHSNYFIKTLIIFTLLIWQSLNFQLSAQTTDGLMLHYQFQNVAGSNNMVQDQVDGLYPGTLKNGATIRQVGDYSLLDLGSDNGYLDLGNNTGSLINTLNDFTVATYLYIANETDLTAPGNFIWTFGNSDNIGSTSNGCMFLSAISTRYAITLTNWRNEQFVKVGSAFSKKSWKHVTYTQKGNTGSIYLDGSWVKSETITVKPKSLGATTHNYIGKSSYLSDVYLKNALYADFRIYNRALSNEELVVLAKDRENLASAYASLSINEIAAALHIDGLNEVISDLDLPTSTKEGVSIRWSSSNESYVSNSGVVIRPSVGMPEVNLILTATLSANGVTKTKVFNCTVLPLYDDANSVSKDKENLILNGNLSNLRTHLVLPESGAEGSSINWFSNDTTFLSNEGQFIRLSPAGTGKAAVSLTAIITKGTASEQKVFEILIAEDEGTSSYLFAYFTGNSGNQEAIRFALSNDGYNYRAMNGNNPILNSADISLTGGIRDPHILRGPDNKFYMVVTDMVSANGWSSNRGMVLLKSDNLTDWTSSTIHIPSVFPETFGDVLRVWAPQTIYDEQAGKFMVYFSMWQPGGVDIIYYAYANESFTALESTPKQLFFSPTNNACIDGDIIKYNGLFHLFFKTEGNGNGIKKATSDKLNEGYVLHDEYLDQSTSGVEGSGVFKLINSDQYILMYDVYTAGHYEFTKSDDLLNFSVIEDEISMNFSPRHGTVIPITSDEAQAVADKWAKSDDLEVISVNSNRIKANNLIIDNVANNIYIPVTNGTDLGSFNPEIKSIPGASISPEGNVDFSKGSVTYTISTANGSKQIYDVSAQVDNNPVLRGYYADPEIMYSHKTGKFHLYPTSDGFEGWGGTYFKTFSSANLVDWKDEGVIVDLPTDVSWASKNAWAPCIIERKINGSYKYFYYFSAAQKIGVAVADDPSGPFVDSGSALIADRPAGASGGQQIDPDVFHDPVSGKYFLYWGNGYMACAELNDDMVSIKQETLKLLTPKSTYREGTEVLFRNGTYYFMWSENDTRSEDYRVRYATAPSPIGPLSVPTDNMVIQKDAEKGIYGTGHNSVIQIPDRDEWYIIYHRFTRPAGITMGSSAGFFREVCIDKLIFNEDGSIQTTHPTVEGIDPVEFSPSNIQTSSHKSSLMIYPNPAKKQICVKSTDYSKIKGNYSILDLSGNKIKQIPQTGNETIIDTSSLKSSLYFLTLSRENKLIDTNKFLIL